MKIQYSSFHEAKKKTWCDLPGVGLGPLLAASNTAGRIPAQNLDQVLLEQKWEAERLSDFLRRASPSCALNRQPRNVFGFVDGLFFFDPK